MKEVKVVASSGKNRGLEIARKQLEDENQTYLEAERTRYVAPGDKVHIVQMPGRKDNAFYYVVDLSALNDDPNVIEKELPELLNYITSKNMVIKNLIFNNTNLGNASEKLVSWIIGSSDEKPYKNIGGLTFNGKDILSKDGKTALDDLKIPGKPEDIQILIKNKIKEKISENRNQLIAEGVEYASTISSGSKSGPSSMVDIKTKENLNSNPERELKKTYRVNDIKNDIKKINEPREPRSYDAIVKEIKGLNEEMDGLMDDLANDFKLNKFRPEPKDANGENATASSSSENESQNINNSQDQSAQYKQVLHRQAGPASSSESDKAASASEGEESLPSQTGPKLSNSN